MMLRLNEETKTNNSKAPKMEKSFKATMNETKVFKTTKMSSLKGQQRNNKLEQVISKPIHRVNASCNVKTQEKKEQKELLQLQNIMKASDGVKKE